MAAEVKGHVVEEKMYILSEDLCKKFLVGWNYSTRTWWEGTPMWEIVSSRPRKLKVQIVKRIVVCL